MRTFLRVLGAVTCGTAVVLFLWLFGSAVYQPYQIKAQRPEIMLMTFPWTVAAAFALVPLAAVGGILYLLAAAAPAPQPVPRRPETMATLLRVLAGVLIGVGLAILLVDGGIVVYALASQPREWYGVLYYSLMYTALGFLTAGVGGVLWCLVRLAYPAPPSAS